MSSDAEKSERVRDFILRCSRNDGGYDPSPERGYPGRSDTSSSDLAAVTYAAVLCRTMGWPLPDAGRSAEFVQSHQRPDGSFANHAGAFNPDDPLAALYNTTQATVALAALGNRPQIHPGNVMDRFFQADRFKKLPWYTTSFFPLFWRALGEKFPEEHRRGLSGYMEENQAEDGYLGNHVAATFHAAHFYRLLGEPTPRASAMVARTVRDQQPDGGWHLFPPDWDVHSCFDALFILRQLGGNDPASTAAIERGAAWAANCQNEDGGFGHFPGWHSDMDAVYFQFGSMIQAGFVPGVQWDLPDTAVLGWGHLMPV